MLPFLALCFLFLILCVLGLVIAYIYKDTGAKDTAIQSVLSASSLTLDFAKLNTMAGPTYVEMSDKSFFIGETKKPDRTLFDQVIAFGTTNCYAVSLYLQSEEVGSTLSNYPVLSGKNSVDKNLCPNMGPASIVLLPTASIALQVPYGADSTMSGVNIK